MDGLKFGDSPTNLLARSVSWECTVVARLLLRPNFVSKRDRKHQERTHGSK
jgi:hypothetical protein